MPVDKIKEMRVLLRVDYNISDYQNLQRIKATLPTISALLKNKNKIIILSHKGRPDGTNNAKLSLEKTVLYLEQELLSIGIKEKIEFINQFDSFVVAKKIIDASSRKIFLLENTRFEEDEQSKDKEKRSVLAEKYATLGNYFVDDAFAVSHRKEATNCEIKEFLLNCYGLSFQEEINNLTKIKESPEHPYIFIMGGAKLETKLNLVKKVLPKADKVILAGLLAFTFLSAAQNLGIKKYLGIDLKNSPIEKEFIAEAEKLFEKYEEKIFLPVDFIYDLDEKFGEYCADVGEKSLEIFKNNLVGAKTIFWNGPLGRYEKAPFERKTKELAEFIANLPDCFTVLGGGDVVTAVPEKTTKKFSFISTGGGAGLKFLSR